MFCGRTTGTLAKSLDCEEVERIREGLAIELLIIKGRGCARRVNEDDCRVSRINAGTGQLVANVDAAKVGYFDGRFAPTVCLLYLLQRALLSINLPRDNLLLMLRIYVNTILAYRLLLL